MGTISDAIERGSDRTTGNVLRANETARQGQMDVATLQESQSQNALRGQAQQIQRQGTIDSKAKPWFDALGQVSAGVEAARTGKEKYMAQLANMPEGPERDHVEKEALSADSAFQLALKKRKDFVMNTVRDPRMSALLQSSSLYNSETSGKILDDETWEAMSDIEQSELIEQATMVQQMMGQTQQQSAIDYQKVGQKVAETAATTQAKLNVERQDKARDPIYPEAEGLDISQYEAAASAYNLPGRDKNVKKSWYQEDISPLYKEYRSINALPDEEKVALAEAMEGEWDPTKDVAIESPIAQDILYTYTKIKKGNQKYRAELFRDTMSPYLKPQAKKAATTRLRAY